MNISVADKSGLRALTAHFFKQFDIELYRASFADRDKNYVVVDFETNLYFEDNDSRDEWDDMWENAITDRMEKWSQELQDDYGIGVDVDESGYEYEGGSDVIIFIKFVQA